MSDTKSSYKEVAEKTVKEQKGNIRSSLVMAGIFTALVVFVAYSLLTGNFSPLYFWILVGFGVVSILACLKTVFDAGCYLAQKEYEPKLCVMEGKYKELKEDFHHYRIVTVENTASHFGEHLALKAFVRGRVPEVLAEYTAWREGPQLSLEEVEDKKVEN